MTRRNANGEAAPYRRKDGRWEACTYGTTASGLHKRISVYGKTRTEVHGKLIELKHRIGQGVPVPDRAWRVGDYLDNWLQHFVKITRRYTTYRRYELTVRLHIKPVLGGLRLSQLSVAQVQHFLNHTLEHGGTLRTAQIAREVLRSALTRAMKEELIFRNVAALTELPGRESSIVQPWTVDECRAFLQAAKDDELYAAFLLMTVYGLRKGEVLGLRWFDIDFTSKTLHIRQQLQRVPGGMALAPLKTKASRRDLELVDLAIQAVRVIRSSGDPLGLVFVDEHGKPLGHNRLSRHFEAICKQYNLRRIRLHDLRHSSATLFKKLGVQPRDAQLILGHADIKTTQQIYQHRDEETQRKTLQQVERLFMRRASPALPSELPSNRMKWPFWNEFTGMNLAPGAGFENDWCLGERSFVSVTETAQARLRTWLIGLVAVSAAVKILIPSEAEEASCVGR